MVRVKIKLEELGILPKKATEGAACYDLHAYHTFEMEGEIKPHIVPIHIYPGERELISVGFSMEIPPGWCAKIYPRSGLGTKGLTLPNCVGIIDSDYRGAVMVALKNETRHSWKLSHGDRIAQMMIERVHPSYFEVVEELGDTERGSGGFGHTGV